MQCPRRQRVYIIVEIQRAHERWSVRSCVVDGDAALHAERLVTRRVIATTGLGRELPKAYIAGRPCTPDCARVIMPKLNLLYGALLTLYWTNAHVCSGIQRIVTTALVLPVSFLRYCARWNGAMSGKRKLNVKTRVYSYGLSGTWKSGCICCVPLHSHNIQRTQSSQSISYSRRRSWYGDHPEFFSA